MRVSVLSNCSSVVLYRMRVACGLVSQDHRLILGLASAQTRDVAVEAF